MKNKRIHRINLEADYDFELIGLSSFFPDYKVCWLINNELNFNFIRIQDLSIYNEKKKTEQLFPLFKYEFDESLIFFISNKSESGLFLEELKMIDYFIIFNKTEDNEDFIKKSVENIKKLKDIQGVFNINVSSLKAKNRLIFEISE